MAETLDSLRARTKPFLDPIAGAPTPAGAALKLDPAYQAVANEVAKLDAPAGGEVDWKAVVRGAGELLRAKTKDVVLASYLAHGLHTTGGLDGLSTGLAIVADLLDQYWDTAFPEVKRIRGRVNAVQWLLERTKAVLPAVQASAGDAAAVDGLEVAAQRLAEVVRARFADQAPAMGPLLDEVARLKGEVEQARPPPPPPPSAGPAAPLAPAQPSAAAAPAPAAPSPLPEAPAGALAGAEQATDFLRNVGTSLASAAGVLRRAEETDPLAYRLLRTGLWLHMQSAPAGAGGKTAVPPPPEPLRAQLAALAQNQKWSALLEEAESALSQHRFWLDLHRHSAQALGALGGGHARAREAVVVELRALLARMPQLPSLSFADGSPLADAQTRSWLDEEVLVRATGGAAGAATAADGADAERLAEAKKQLAGGQVAEALGALRAVAAARADGRGRFAARLELARAAAGAGLLALAKATYDELDREALEHRLDDWEPALAAETLKGLIAATRSLSNDPRGVRDTLVMQYQRLCRLDPAAAHQVWP